MREIHSTALQNTGPELLQREYANGLGSLATEGVTEVSEFVDVLEKYADQPQVLATLAMLPANQHAAIDFMVSHWGMILRPKQIASRIELPDGSPPAVARHHYRRMMEDLRHTPLGREVHDNGVSTKARRLWLGELGPDAVEVSDDVAEPKVSHPAVAEAATDVLNENYPGTSIWYLHWKKPTLEPPATPARLQPVLDHLLKQRGQPQLITDLLDMIPGASRDASKKAFHAYLKSVAKTELGKELCRYGNTTQTWYWLVDHEADPPVFAESRIEKRDRLQRQTDSRQKLERSKPQPKSKALEPSHLPPNDPQPLPFVRPLGYFGPENVRAFRPRPVSAPVPQLSAPGYAAVSPIPEPVPQRVEIKSLASEVPDWRSKSECIGDGANGLFLNEDLPKWEIIAKRICGTCAVVDQCIEEALNIEPEFGIWGGLQACQLELFADRSEDPLVAKRQIQAVTDVIRDGKGIRTGALRGLLQHVESQVAEEQSFSQGDVA